MKCSASEEFMAKESLDSVHIVYFSWWFIMNLFSIYELVLNRGTYSVHPSVFKTYETMEFIFQIIIINTSYF